ncbi:hypothetical protein PHYSODRAFT_421492, partial [Phytophthora sojae]
MDGIYYDAASSKDYQDAALLALMWYTFGRASDLGFVAKSSLSVIANAILSIFPEKDSFITCPMHAVAMTLVMQDFPSSQVLEHPQLFDGSAENLAAPDDVPLAASKAQARAKPTPNLSSHSFRRGGAQHVNSDPSLCAQWIFDRGSWNMTATNKAFAYVFNTTSEDQKVSRVLSGWDSCQKPPVPMLSWFDLATKSQALSLAALLFQTSLNTQDPEKRLNDRVADVLVAALIQRFPEILDRYPMCPYVTRMRQCLLALGISKAQVLAWSSELQR